MKTIKISSGEFLGMRKISVRSSHVGKDLRRVGMKRFPSEGAEERSSLLKLGLLHFQWCMTRNAREYPICLLRLQPCWQISGSYPKYFYIWMRPESENTWFQAGFLLQMMPKTNTSRFSLWRGILSPFLPDMLSDCSCSTVLSLLCCVFHFEMHQLVMSFGESSGLQTGHFCTQILPLRNHAALWLLGGLLLKYARPYLK